MFNFILKQQESGHQLIYPQRVKTSRKPKINKYVRLSCPEFQIKTSFTDGKNPNPSSQTFITIKIIS